MEIPENPRIAIVGGGSWATAIAKILLETNEHINWFMRNIETINAFKELNHNPRYLCSVDFDLSRISFTDNLDKLIAPIKKVRPVKNPPTNMITPQRTCFIVTLPLSIAILVRKKKTIP